MFPMKLTDAHYINPQRVAYISFRPKQATTAAALVVVFTSNELLPLELRGDQAEVAIANWQNFYDNSLSKPSFEKGAAV